MQNSIVLEKFILELISSLRFSFSQKNSNIVRDRSSHKKNLLRIFFETSRVSDVSFGIIFFSISIPISFAGRGVSRHDEIASIKIDSRLTINEQSFIKGRVQMGVVYGGWQLTRDFRV